MSAKEPLLLIPTVLTLIHFSYNQGSIVLKAGPDAPFQNDGTFNIHGNGFVFSSGTLSGSGK